MKILPIVLAAAAAVAPFAASANTPAPGTEEIVFVYDVKPELLETPAGVDAAYARLEQRARAACSLSGVRGLSVVDQACVAELVEKVVAAIDSAALEQRHVAGVSDTFDVAAR